MRLLLFIILLSSTFTFSSAFAQNHYKEIDRDGLSQILHSNTGQKKVLLVYASWCPHCQVIFPELIEIEKDHSGSVHAVSMDKDMDRFTAFIKQFPDLPIDPLIWNKEYHMGISLNELGINFSGFIPFIALIDGNGKTVKEGYISSGEIKEFLK